MYYIYILYISSQQAFSDFVPAAIQKTHIKPTKNHSIGHWTKQQSTSFLATPIKVDQNWVYSGTGVLIKRF